MQIVTVYLKELSLMIISWYHYKTLVFQIYRNNIETLRAAELRTSPTFDADSDWSWTTVTLNIDFSNAFTSETLTKTSLSSLVQIVMFIIEN